MLKQSTCQVACDCLFLDKPISTSSSIILHEITSHILLIYDHETLFRPSTMSTPRFQNYPIAHKGPEEPFKKEDLALPVLRGPSLSIGATVYVKILHYFIQNSFFLT